MSNLLTREAQTWRVLELSTCRYENSEMAVVLFDDDRWRSLLAFDGFRLADYPFACRTENAAKLCCYQGLNIFLSVRNLSLPPIDELFWTPPPDPERWVQEFYGLPLHQS